MEVPRLPEIALRTEGLSKRFGAVEALHELDLEVAAGEVVGFDRRDLVGE